MAIDRKTGQGTIFLTHEEENEAMRTLNLMQRFACGMLIAAVRDGMRENFVLGYLSWPASRIEEAKRLCQFILTHAAD